MVCLVEIVKPLTSWKELINLDKFMELVVNDAIGKILMGVELVFDRSIIFITFFRKPWLRSIRLHLCDDRDGRLLSWM